MRNKPQILVINDSEDMGIILKKALVLEGYSVFTALDGVKGLEMVKEKKPDIVLLDLKLPKMDGINVLRGIKKIDKNIVVIIITAFGSMDTARMAMKFGAFDYVTKPLDLDYVKAVIKDGLKLSLRAFGDRMKAKEILKSIRTQQRKTEKLSHCKRTQACFWEVALMGFVLGDENIIVDWMEDPQVSNGEKLDLTKIAELLKVGI